MTAARRIPVAVRMWLGLLGAPIAWTVQFVFGFGLTQWQCSVAGRRQSIPVDTWTAIATALAASIGVLGLLASLSAWAQTRGAEEPPEGRVHFLAVIGITITPLFLAIVVLSGLGVLNLENCVQS